MLSVSQPIANKGAGGDRSVDCAEVIPSPAIASASELAAAGGTFVPEVKIPLYRRVADPQHLANRPIAQVARLPALISYKIVRWLATVKCATAR
jgi:hypothetical protein